jgi:hypothetical protein
VLVEGTVTEAVAENVGEAVSDSVALTPGVVLWISVAVNCIGVENVTPVDDGTIVTLGTPGKVTGDAVGLTVAEAPCAMFGGPPILKLILKLLAASKTKISTATMKIAAAFNAIITR